MSDVVVLLGLGRSSGSYCLLSLFSQPHLLLSTYYPFLNFVVACLFYSYY